MEQITYIKTGDYYIPDWKLPEETRPIFHPKFGYNVAF